MFEIVCFIPAPCNPACVAGKGTCNNGACNCNPGYTGNDCGTGK